MTVRMIGYYCPNGHLHEGIGYEGEQRSKSMFQHLIEEMVESKRILLACRECGAPILTSGWKYRDTVVPDCGSLEEFLELMEAKGHPTDLHGERN